MCDPIAICMCGASAGYPHEHDCPYPLFRAGRRQEEAWLEARQQLRQRLAAQLRHFDQLWVELAKSGVCDA